jgi:hypothetical protein
VNSLEADPNQELTNEEPISVATVDSVSKSAFLMNVGSISNNTGLEIIHRYTLRRANESEIRDIKLVLPRYRDAPQPLIEWFWECEWPLRDGTITSLPINEQRYFVLHTDENLDKFNELEKIFALSEIEIMMGFTIYNHGLGLATASHPAKMFHNIEKTLSPTWKFHQITKLDIEKITLLYNKYINHDHSIFDMKVVLEELVNLNQIKGDSSFRFLGYFGLLELMITHKPRPSDPYEAILDFFRYYLGEDV